MVSARIERISNGWLVYIFPACTSEFFPYLTEALERIRKELRPAQIEAAKEARKTKVK